MAGIGHNSGRVIEPGHTWRKHVWTKARKKLMPTLPVEVIRMRVRRAAELGLPYKTYAGIRASSGDDLIGFMFSNNALRVLRAGQAMAADRKRKLDQLIGAQRIALAHAPAMVKHLQALPQIDRAFRAPQFTDSWSSVRDQFRAMTADAKTPASRLVLVGDTAFEREWVETGKMAGYVPADVYFAQAVV
ncbi:hypothetical protein SAMN04488005_1921 [Yoonia tamlensis]|uniref:Uncharacterized protein n=1 Tax=Yoonia tamlensis TaxID=390270 RepID=A0A1I6GMU4_9RHOB|nr:hypothetical protein [Yoonia tamlensis]SFR43545.1 hypothetical protein SAMN04488005_1921 [Yoonia tamlensis]